MSNSGKFAKIKKLLTATSMLTAVLSAGSAGANEFVVNYGDLSTNGLFSSFGVGGGYVARYDGSGIWTDLGISFSALQNNDVVILTNDARVSLNNDVNLWFGADNANDVDLYVASNKNVTILGASKTPDVSGSVASGQFRITAFSGSKITFGDGNSSTTKTITNDDYLSRTIKSNEEAISKIEFLGNNTLIGNIAGGRFSLTSTVQGTGSITFQDMDVNFTSGSMAWSNVTLSNSKLVLPGSNPLGHIYINSGTSTIENTTSCYSVQFQQANASLSVSKNTIFAGAIKVLADSSIVSGTGSVVDVSATDYALQFNDTSSTFTIDNVNLKVRHTNDNESKGTNASLALTNSVGLSSLYGINFSLNNITLNNNVTFTLAGTITVDTLDCKGNDFTLSSGTIKVTGQILNKGNFYGAGTIIGPTYFSSNGESKTITSTNHTGNINTVSTNNTLNLVGATVTGDIGDSNYKIANLNLTGGASSVSGTTYVDKLQFAQSDASFTISNTLNVTNNIDVAQTGHLVGSGGQRTVNSGGVNFSNSNASLSLQNIALTAGSVSAGADNTLALNSIVNLTTPSFNIGTLLLTDNTTFTGNGQTITLDTIDFNNYTITFNNVVVDVLTALKNGTAASNITLGNGATFTNKTNYFTGPNQVKTYSGEGDVVNVHSATTLKLSGVEATSVVNSSGDLTVDVYSGDNKIKAYFEATNLIFTGNGAKLTIGGDFYVNPTVIITDTISVESNSNALIGNTNIVVTVSSLEFLLGKNGKDNQNNDVLYNNFTLDKFNLTITNPIAINNTVTIDGSNTATLISDGGMEIANGQEAGLSNITFQGYITDSGSSVLHLNTSTISDGVNVSTVGVSGIASISNALTTNDLQLNKATLTLTAASENINIAQITVVDDSTLVGNGQSITVPKLKLMDGEGLTVDNMTVKLRAKYFTDSDGYKLGNGERNRVVLNNGAVTWLESEFFLNDKATYTLISHRGEDIVTDYAESTLILNGYNVTGNVGDSLDPINKIVVTNPEGRESTITGNIEAKTIELAGGTLIMQGGNINTETISITSNNTGEIKGNTGNEEVTSKNGFTFEADNHIFALTKLTFNGKISSGDKAGTELVLRNANVNGNLGATGHNLPRVVIGDGNSTVVGNVYTDELRFVGNGQGGGASTFTATNLTATNVIFNAPSTLEVSGNIGISNMILYQNATLRGDQQTPQTINIDNLDLNGVELTADRFTKITVLKGSGLHANGVLTGLKGGLFSNGGIWHIPEIEGFFSSKNDSLPLNNGVFTGNITTTYEDNNNILILNNYIVTGSVGVPGNNPDTYTIDTLQINGNSEITDVINVNNVDLQGNLTISKGFDVTNIIVNKESSLIGKGGVLEVKSNQGIYFADDKTLILKNINFTGNVTKQDVGGTLILEVSTITGNVEGGLKALTINPGGDSKVTGKIYAKALNLGGNLEISSTAEITEDIAVTANSTLSNGVNGKISAKNLDFNGAFALSLDGLPLTIENQITAANGASIVGVQGTEVVNVNGQGALGLVFNTDNAAFTLKNLAEFNGDATTTNAGSKLTLENVVKFDGSIGGAGNSLTEVIIAGGGDSTIKGAIYADKISLNGAGKLTLEQEITTGELVFTVAGTEVSIAKNSVINYITVTGNNTSLIGSGSQRTVDHGTHNTQAILNFDADSEFTLKNITFKGDVTTYSDGEGALILETSVVQGDVGSDLLVNLYYLRALTINGGQSGVDGKIYAKDISFAQDNGQLFIGDNATITEKITINDNSKLLGWSGLVDNKLATRDVSAKAIHFAGNHEFSLEYINFTGKVTTHADKSGTLILKNSKVTGDIGAANTALAGIDISGNAEVTGTIRGDVIFSSSSTLNAGNIIGNITIDDWETATLEGAGIVGITGIASGGANAALVLKNNITVTGDIGALKEINLGNNVELIIDGKNATKNIYGTDSSTITIKNPVSSTNLNNVGTQNAPIKSVTVENGGILVGDIYAKTIYLTNAAAKTLEFAKSITANTVALSGGAHNIDIGQGVSFYGDITLAHQGGTLTFKGSANFSGNLGKGNTFTKISIANANSTIIGDGSISAKDVNHSAGTLYLLGNLTVKGSYNLKGGTLELNHHELMADKLLFDVGNSTIKVDMASGGYISTKEMDFVDTAAVNIIVTDDLVPKSGSTFDLIVADKTTQDRSKILEYLANDKLVKISSTNRFGNYILKLIPIETGSLGVKLQAVTERQASKDTELILSSSGSMQSILKDMLSAWDQGYMSGSAEALIASLGSMSSERASECMSRLTSPSISTIAHSVVSSAVAASHTAIVSRVSTASMALAAADDKVVELGVWGSGFGGHASQKAYGKQEGAKTNSKGMAIGLDAEVNDDTMVGLAAAHSVSKVKLTGPQEGDVVDSTNYNFSFYGAANLGNNWFAEGSASLGNSHIRSASNRIIGDNASAIAKSKFDIVSYSGQIVGGYNYKISDDTVLSPLAGVSYVRYNSASTKETGAGVQNRNIYMKAINKVDGIFGARMNHNIILDDNNLINLELRATGERAFKSKAPSTDIKLEGYDKSLSKGSEKPARNGFNIGTSVTAKSGMIEYGAGYDFHSSKKYQAHQGSVKLKVYF